MTEQTPRLSRHDMEARLVAKAWKDETFEQQLLSNPKATIEQEFNIQLPEQMHIQILQENANTMCINLPVRPDLGGAEISDQELEAVAGGGWGAIIGTVEAIAGVGALAYSLGHGAGKKWD